ncbi:MAG TPA: transketolase C-terminal domain-containing protein [Candidatus Thermoplasmatota archaeon]|nr:transketolase C-terminal domain-containing protein [Candidatus Thermoplasmatota archaeon]
MPAQAATVTAVPPAPWQPGEKVAIRDGYGKGLVALGRLRDDVVALDADLAESTRSHWFAREFPNRFYEMGIAEQDMVVTASGLAHMGKLPFASSFAIFLERGWEQVRNCVARQNLNVKFCGSHGGLMTGQDGSSAHALEDIAIFRTLPSMAVCVPSDAVEAHSAVFAMADRPGPCYMRSTRAAVPVVHEPDHQFQWGKGDIIRDGDDVALMANGPQVNEALEAARKLQAEHGLSARVVALASVKPLDRPLVAKCLRECGFAVTAEDHFITNGLGSAVAESVAEERIDARLGRVGVRDTFTQSGTPQELYRYYELDAQAIADMALAIRRKDGK